MIPYKGGQIKKPLTKTYILNGTYYILYFTYFLIINFTLIKIPGTQVYDMT